METVNVVKRGRKPIQINAAEFQNVLQELEKNNSFRNRTELWQAVERTDWAKGCTPRPLTAQVAMVKCEEMNLIVNTPKGKRGREKGERVPNAGRKKKVFSLPMLQSGVPADERAGLQKTLQRAAGGSLKARIKLLCLDCTNWQKVEVAECTIKTCPMWDVRPYKRGLTTTEGGISTEAQTKLSADAATV